MSPTRFTCSHKPLVLKLHGCAIRHVLPSFVVGPFSAHMPCHRHATLACYPSFAKRMSSSFTKQLVEVWLRINAIALQITMKKAPIAFFRSSVVSAILLNSRSNVQSSRCLHRLLLIEASSRRLQILLIYRGGFRQASALYLY